MTPAPVLLLTAFLNEIHGYFYEVFECQQVCESAVEAKSGIWDSRKTVKEGVMRSR
jgi:hypothetical protein